MPKVMLLPGGHIKDSFQIGFQHAKVLLIQPSSAVPASERFFSLLENSIRNISQARQMENCYEAPLTFQYNEVSRENIIFLWSIIVTVSSIIVGFFEHRVSP